MNIQKKRFISHSIKRLCVGVIAGLLAASSLSLTVQAEKAVVSSNNGAAFSKVKVPELKPSWSLKVDNKLDSGDPDISSNYAAVEDSKVFTFIGKKLVAVDAKTGEQLWSYGKNLTPHVVYDNGMLYGLSGDQKPYALHAKTGKVKWLSKSPAIHKAQPGMEAMMPKSDSLYVIKGSTTFAFDKITGKLRWKADETGGNGTDYIEEASGVILRTFLVQGALTSVQLDAFDKKTGKKLWGIFGQGDAIRIKDGLVYSIDHYSQLMTDYESLPERKVIINVYNLKTGVKKGTREYNWKQSGLPPYPFGQGNVIVHGDKIYIQQADKVAEYDFDSYKPNPVPLRTFKIPYGDNWTLINLVQDRLIFKNNSTNEITGIKTVNNRQVGWNGDAPLAQVDVFQKGVFRAQRNGTLLGINFLTTKPMFRITTGSDLHEATLKTGDMIIIQAEGKLLGVKLPAALS
ncbi:PQQ-binding-like beta-propeller repeat protein [Paenibacillus lemnae]|uniref:PQQ-binding-like beta-propeller repeat protein n=1 Tax=Paenibacillus lemnae TaxID=1330551 RepID=A0A848MAH1_PAELE|nr:PQQ-binding-like beta-propeller repeat protein [Paenibacillus lemnae]NMO98248.1 PQQ-binding-like beta-propeller repeat protein [Paenibacillus lemnae]